MKNLINNNLKKYRTWNGLTQRELAGELRISVQQLMGIEKHRYPKYQIRARICKYFNVSQDQMFYKVEKEDSMQSHVLYNATASI